MNLRLATATLLFTAIPIVVLAQQNGPAGQPPKPTTADVQKLVQTISGDKTKLQAYCDMGEVLAQLDQAKQKKDTNALKTLRAKADGLAQQLGPDCSRIMEGLNQIDPRSNEGKRISALFQPIFTQCK
jgi:ABC-type transporter Mla subunit MlaD